MVHVRLKESCIDCISRIKKCVSCFLDFEHRDIKFSYSSSKLGQMGKYFMYPLLGGVFRTLVIFVHFFLIMVYYVHYNKEDIKYLEAGAWFLSTSFAGAECSASTSPG